MKAVILHITAKKGIKQSNTDIGRKLYNYVHAIYKFIFAD
jgi:hypothetical protein